MTVRFEIDKARQDSFYHYKKYNDANVCVQTGWGIWSKQTTENDREAWLKAVQEYQSSHKVKTEADKVKDCTSSIREKLKIDASKIENKKPLAMPSLTTIIDAFRNAEIGGCTDDYISMMMGLVTGGVPTSKAVFQYTWNAAWFNTEVDLQKLVSDFSSLGISGLILPALDLIDKAVDSTIGSVSAVYSEVLKISATAIYYYSQMTNLFGCAGRKEETEEYRKKLWEEIHALTMKYGTAFGEFLYEVLCIQSLLDTLQVIESGVTSTAGTWKSITNKIRTLTLDDWKVIGTSAVTQTLEFFKNMLPMLAAIAGAFIVLKCMSEKEKEQSLQDSADTLGVSPEDIETTLNKSIHDNQEALSRVAVVYSNAVNNVDGFSLTPQYASSSPSTYSKTPPAEVSNVICNGNSCNCKLSMCDASDPVDASMAINSGSLDFSSAIVIEIQKDLNYRFIVTVGSVINANDIIAYINNVPIRANGNYQVLETHGNYIIVKENINKSFLDASTAEDAEILAQKVVQAQIGNVDLAEYNNVVDKYSKFSYADIFIRQYMSYYKFPELAQYTREHTNGDATELSSDDFIEEYERYADNYYDSYEKGVQSIVKEKNIKGAVKNGKISDIKKKLDGEKVKFNENIMALYDANPGNIKYCSKGRLADYMLYANYLNYLTSDRFEYDEDNQYVKSIYDHISDYIGTRARIELNLDSIKSLYAKFNEFCAKYISKYWTVNKKDYYTALCELFKYNSYADSTDILEDTSKTGLSLYKRVLNYLKAISMFTPDATYAVEVNENSDVNKLMEEQGKKSEDSSYDKDKLKFEKNLKQIAFRFAAMRKIELSLNNTKISTYITNEQLNKFNALHTAIGDKIYEYDDREIYLPTDPLYNKKIVINPILDMMKAQTAKEAAELRKITKDCISWYNENFDSLMYGGIFKSFAQIQWPDPSVLYRGSDKLDYYLFTTLGNPDLIPPTTQDELEKLEDSVGIISEKGTVDVTDPKTAARIYDLKYWLKYCAVASLVGAMLPPFWSTGTPTPAMLPIVYMPFVVIKGRVILVAGLGICGMSVLPMMMFINTSTVNGLFALPANTAIDSIIAQLKQISNAKLANAKGMFVRLIDSLNAEVNKYENEITNINYQIDEVQHVPVEYKAEKAIRTIENEDLTFKATNPIDLVSGDVEPNNFVATYPPGQQIDYLAIIDQIDTLTKYNNDYKSLEELSEIFGTMYQSSSAGGNGGISVTDADFTYEKFEEVCRATNCNASSEVYSAIVAAFNDSLKSVSIDDYDKMADLSAYLANTSVECGFKAVHEYANYSKEAILKTWKGSYFNPDGTPVYKTVTEAGRKIPIKTAAQYATDGENLFNYVYGTTQGKVGRYGNDTWGDGYMYRGGGFTQLTFKGSYIAYNEFCNTYFNKSFNLVANPDNINNVEAAAYTSVAHWINRNGPKNLHNVWTANPDIMNELDMIQPSVSNMPCTSSQYPGVFKSGITKTEQKVAACFALVAGSYPTDRISETAKVTYVKKLKAFIKIYKILTQ